MSELFTIIPNHERHAQLRQMLFDRLKPILAGREVVFIDYPLHLNVGDLLIQAGTEQILKDLGARIIMRVSTRNAERLFARTFAQDVVMLCHGGGNFGDLYPHHQQLRDKVVAAFPHNPVVLMPQSVHFSGEQQLVSLMAAYASHVQLTMFVRDQPSYDLMTSVLRPGQVELLPDMAFGLHGQWPWPVTAAPQQLIFRRRDIEAVNSGESGFDWDDLLSKTDHFCYDLARRWARLEQKFGLGLGLDRFWLWYGRWLIKRAAEYFRQYGCIDTDRLHGLILAQLVGLPVNMRDNSYGKLRRFASCWLGFTGANGVEVQSL